MRSSIKAFTLIELLVVIAIIAILAAILFPVFAQAKAAAKKTQCLSGVKQVGTSFHIYIGDNDDVTPSQWGGMGACEAANGYAGCSQEWWYGLHPYMKSTDLLLCPERMEGDKDSYNALGQSFGIKRYTGYGYNWGPIGWRGGGLLNLQEYDTVTGRSYLRGKNLSSVDQVAGTFAFGETYDTPRMTLGIGFAGDTWRGTKNAALRHGASFPYSFVDGHAKSVKVQGGNMNGGFSDRMIMVKDMNLGKTAYCSDPNAIINDTNDDDDMAVPDGLLCGNIAQYIQDNFPICATPTSTNCRYSD
jgi:prepilin-type N-terminal cleavage/methylation domain-containing protein/prepilin-type processing-associated H-X9-DG protein